MRINLIKWLSRLWLTHKALSVIIIRRYTITTGNVGELYIDGKCIGDTLDTYSPMASSVKAIAIVDEFFVPHKDNVLLVNASYLDGKELSVEFRNAWACEC